MTSKFVDWNGLKNVSKFIEWGKIKCEAVRLLNNSVSNLVYLLWIRFFLLRLALFGDFYSLKISLRTSTIFIYLLRVNFDYYGYKFNLNNQ